MITIVNTRAPTALETAMLSGESDQLPRINGTASRTLISVAGEHGNYYRVDRTRIAVALRETETRSLN